MQIIQSRGLPAQAGNLIEKVIRDKHGKLARATFYVYENGGRIKARLVSAEIISETLEDKVLSLPGFSIIKFFNDVIKEFKTVSPFFTFSTLYTTGSKPRAPTI